MTHANHPSPGSTWRHYKGVLYTVLAVAEYTESGECLVIYQAAEGPVWARPMDLWHEHVLMGDVPRFSLVKPKPEPA